jgi:hypothetical protein
MIKKNSVIHTVSIIIAIIGLLSPAAEGEAFFYRLPAAVGILSEYNGLAAAPPQPARVWKVVPEAAADGATILRFFLEAQPTADAVCELRLPPSGAGGEIRWKGIGKGGEKRGASGLLLTPGFPAPCDILPVGAREEGAVYHENIEAGGSVFSRSWRVSSALFSAADARAKGWIREGAPGPAELIMVTVSDDKGRLTVRQLWPAAGTGSWWLYEETPLRRSWLIY